MTVRRPLQRTRLLFVASLPVTAVAVLALNRYVTRPWPRPLAVSAALSVDAGRTLGAAAVRDWAAGGDRGAAGEADATEGILGSSDHHHPWCSGTTVQSAFVHRNASASAAKRSGKTAAKHFLTAVLLVRIYGSDRNRYTSSELFQWLQYMSYAGVEHVYVYDGYVHRNESQREALRCFVRSGFVTYVDWHHKAVDRKDRDRLTQLPAYRDCLWRFGHQFVWQAEMDIDEYPFCPKDRAAGFLARFVRGAQAAWPGGRILSLGQIFLQNFLFLGPPPNVTELPLVVDRFRTRTRHKWNENKKPIFLSEAAFWPGVHGYGLGLWYSNYHAPEDLIRMNHYHGSRHYRSGKTVRATEVDMVEDRGMSTASSVLTLCRTVGCAMGCCR